MDLPVRMLNSDGDSASGNISELLDEPMAIHTFPTLEELRISTEEELRDMGLGYRAKYIIQTRDLLIENGGKEYLLNLRTKDAPTAQEALLQFSGIGRKVADCVALFSLDQCEAIPVDIHVQHIASRDYDPSVLGGAKSLTPTIYNRVGDLFRDRFEYAGWAHSLLFVAELPSFRNVLPDDIVAEMDAVSLEVKVNGQRIFPAIGSHHLVHNNIFFNHILVERSRACEEGRSKGSKEKEIFRKAVNVAQCRVEV